MNRTHIAALLTCYNRKQKTLDCLAALFNQERPSEIEIDIYLVDDGSTDGTADAVLQVYPHAKIVTGNGSLFWGGGMRLAFETARKDNPDYYLWLNDDTILYSNALKILLETEQQLKAQSDTCSVIAGSTCDAETGNLTYGGVVRKSSWRPLKFYLVEPGETAKPCDTINGNCVLIPREAAQIVGNIDPAFTHYAGDWDYGLRAKQQGCSLWIAPGYVGTCSQNYQPGTKTEVSFDKSDMKKIGQPKGLAIREQTLHPISEWKVFAQRYAGRFWIIFWLIPYRRLILPAILGKL